MKRFLLSIAIMTVSLAMPAFADVGVTVNIGQPGFYGQLDMGDAPQPRLVSRHPIIIERVRERVFHEPVYLHVPVSHQRNWRRYCGRYDACGRPVYFVDRGWYSKVYVPHYRERREHYDRRNNNDRYNGRHNDHNNERDYGRNDRGGRDQHDRR